MSMKNHIAGEITKDQALYLLPDTEEIHVNVNTSIFLFGANWSRDEVLDLIEKADHVTRSGEIASSMNYGLVIYPPDAKYQSDLYFVETNMERCAEIDKELEEAENG